MEWISVSNKYPPYDRKFLAFYCDQYMDVMEFLYQDEEGQPVYLAQTSWGIKQISHWMECPEPPK